LSRFTDSYDLLGPVTRLVDIIGYISIPFPGNALRHHPKQADAEDQEADQNSAPPEVGIDDRIRWVGQVCDAPVPGFGFEEGEEPLEQQGHFFGRVPGLDGRIARVDASGPDAAGEPLCRPKPASAAALMEKEFPG